MQQANYGNSVSAAAEKSQQLRAGYADCYLGQLHFLSRLAPAGGKRPILLLNPRSRSCRKLVPFLPADHSVFIVDIPGLGMSSPLLPGASMPDVARAVAEFMDFVGTGPSHVFGIHTGGKVAAALAAGWPDKVHSVIICGKSHSIVPSLERRNPAMKEQADMPDSAVLRYEGKYLDEMEGNQGMAKLYEANFAFDLAAAVGTLRIPLLVLEITSPREDAKYGRQSHALAGLAQRGRMQELPQIDATGIDFYTGPEAMARAIGDFFGQAETSRPIA